MKWLAPLVLLLAACVSPEGSVQQVDGQRLQVRLDDSYFWPDSFTDKPSGQVIDVFPLVTALVVSRADGVALTGADEPAARRAVNAHCAANGAEAVSASSRFADGAWAFFSCL